MAGPSAHSHHNATSSQAQKAGPTAEALHPRALAMALQFQNCPALSPAGGRHRCSRQAAGSKQDQGRDGGARRASELRGCCYSPAPYYTNFHASQFWHEEGTLQFK
ncbi:unnamed protein product [Sphagnum tenellum]